MSERDLGERATADAENLLSRLEAIGLAPSPEHVARMAWLDGYEAGHTDATAHAIRTLGGTTTEASTDAA